MMLNHVKTHPLEDFSPRFSRDPDRLYPLRAVDCVSYPRQLGDWYLGRTRCGTLANHGPHAGNNDGSGRVRGVDFCAADARTDWLGHFGQHPEHRSLAGFVPAVYS